MNLLFDLDGTIGNTLPLCVAAFQNAIEPFLERHLKEEEIIAQFGPSEEGTIQALAPNHYHKVLLRYLEWYEKLHARYPSPFGGMPELLQYAKNKGAYLGLITGKGARSTEITLVQYGLNRIFDSVKTGSPDGPVKDLRMREVLEETQFPTASFLYVGDAPSDIDACRKAGIRIAAAAWAETTDLQSLTAKNPDYLF